VRTAALLMAHLSAPDAVGHRARHLDCGSAPLVAGHDVEKDQLIGALVVVDARLRHRVAGIPQVDKVDALDDAAVGHVETRDDAFGQHGQIASASRSAKRPS
jgi:hypothetical protein